MPLIGVLHWVVEIGRIDVTCEVSILSSHFVMPREGHLKQLYHVFAFLKNHHNSCIVFDPSYPDIDLDEFPRCDWRQYYDDGEEQILDGCPRPLGKELLIHAHIDADFAGEGLIRRSRTGYIVILNNAPIYWNSKKQTACETSSFGNEFLALKSCCEYLCGLRAKLR